MDCDYKLDQMKKNNEIIKGVSDGLKKTAPIHLFDSNREDYEWVYSEIIRVTHLLGGKERGGYKPDVYTMMCYTHGFHFSHMVTFRKSVDEGNITGGIVTDLDFGVGVDINGMVYILFDYLFTPDSDDFLVKETMHNQRCLSINDVKFMRETEDSVFYFLISVIDDIYRKRYGKSQKDSFWDDGDLEFKYIELDKKERYLDSNNVCHSTKCVLTGRKSWFDEYYKNKEERSLNNY